MDEFDRFAEERGRSKEPCIWQIAKKNLKFDVPDKSPTSEAWKRFAISLHDMVIQWEEKQKCKFRHTTWAFSIIHSEHPDDTALAADIIRMLESIGLSGVKLGDIEPGEGKLETAESMVNGSTKVFILVTPYIFKPGLPKFTYYESLMQRLYNRGEWRAKLIPLIPPPDHIRQNMYQLTAGSTLSCSVSEISEASTTPPSRSISQISSSVNRNDGRQIDFQQNQIHRPFWLANIAEIKMGTWSETCDQIHTCILPQELGLIEKKRSNEASLYKLRLDRLRKKAFNEISEILRQIKEKYQHREDPSDVLNEITFQLTNIDLGCGNTLSEMNTEQLVRIINCSDFSMGTTINFNIN